MKSLLTSTLLIFFLGGISVSLTWKDTPAIENHYGDKQYLEIYLFKDQTFTYSQQLNKKELTAKGKWSIDQNNNLHLAPTEQTGKIIEKWKIADQRIKGKKGMAFYTLVGKCK